MMAGGKCLLLLDEAEKICADAGVGVGGTGNAGLPAVGEAAPEAGGAAQCAFYCVGRFERLDRLPGRAPGREDAEYRPAGAARGDF